MKKFIQSVVSIALMVVLISGNLFLAHGLGIDTKSDEWTKLTNGTHQINFKLNNKDTEASTVDRDSLKEESIDDWMPDKVLQTQVAEVIRVSTDKITKELMSTQEFWIDIGFSDDDTPTIHELTGIEYAKEYTIMLTANKNIATNDLSSIISDHLENLKIVNWYSGDLGYSQVDLYSVFKNWSILGKPDWDTGGLIITGRMAYPSTQTLTISGDAYSDGGILSISLKDIGIWSTLDYQLFNYSFDSINDLVIKKGPDVLATYKYSYFDVATQSFIFNFDKNNSKSTEELKGQKLNYNLTTPEEDYNSVPMFEIEENNKTNVCDLLFDQYRISYYFPSVEFVSHGGNITVEYVDEKGNSLTDPTVLTGDIEEEYTTVEKTFKGYSLKEVQGNRNGIFIESIQTVTYVYAKDPKPSDPEPSDPKPSDPKPPAPSQTVILASGEKYTDVLTATVLGNEKNAPILLTTKDNIDEKTLAEIKRLSPSEIIISGGEASVSRKVVDQLSDYKVTRIAGQDRYETAEKIGNEVRKTGNKDGAMLVDGTNFPDVITISSLASQKRVPILLTEPKDLNITTKNAIGTWGVNNVTIGGSYNSVSKDIENNLIVNKVARFGGSDRYETAALIGNEVRKDGCKDDMILVDGTNFPDGITINSLSAHFNAPIMLTEPNKLNIITDDKTTEWSIKNILIGGGYNSVSKNIEDNLNVNKKERVAGSDRYETAVKVSQRLSESNTPLGGK